MYIFLEDYKIVDIINNNFIGASAFYFVLQ